MKVLSLSQPWAGLAFTKHPQRDHAVKDWETRSWKPCKENMDIIRRDGMLIHASLTWKKLQKELMKTDPFAPYADADMQFGFIIGKVSVGRIIRTEQWLHESKEFKGKPNEQRWIEQQAFGDYSPNRWAWELTSFQKFDSPIPIGGALSLWDFPMCKICGCWENDACLHPARDNCHWAADDLCSHCAVSPGQATRYSKL